ncbi:hypothetical protein [Duganella rhizosphaerae]|uniref:hypothetical protein n=1 Tax=Duganella rhizosphaerae TaxID=2885763 RepID=UPI00403F09CF
MDKIFCNDVKNILISVAASDISLADGGCGPFLCARSSPAGCRATCMGFMQMLRDSHNIPSFFARLVAQSVSNWQHVAISYKLLMQCNTLRG